MNSKKINTNKCFVVNIPQIVTTRKYKVDIDSLKILLRNSKKASKLSCKQISEIHLLVLKTRCWKDYIR